MKQQLLLKASVQVALAALMLNLPRLAHIEMNPLVMVFMVVMPLFFGFRAFSYFKQAKKATDEVPGTQPATPPTGTTNTKPGPQNTAPLNNTTADEQIQLYNRLIFMAVVIFPLLSLLIIRKLNDLRSGAIERYQVWEPLAHFHEQNGYNTTILVVPFIGVLVVAALFIKVYSLKSNRG